MGFSQKIVVSVFVAALSQPALCADDVRHLLDRITFGATPALVAQVQEIGMDAYLEQQLNPAAIADTSMARRLAPYETLDLGSKELIQAYYGRIKQFLNNQQLTANMSDEARTRYGLERLAGERQDVGEMNRSQQLELVLSRLDYRAIGELQTTKLIRAVHSEHQLYEVMVDFWTNHFNIDVSRGAAGPLKVVDDRDVIRRHALGNFRDLLHASAQSPAMLFYLDNNENAVRRKLGGVEKLVRGLAIRYLVGVSADAADANGDAMGMIGGLNENYARELLELHTLGVNGGYSQADVIAVARAFTGWGFNPFNGRFAFNRANHDPDPKMVLGVSVLEGRQADGERVLDLIALHPATARHLAYKLCQRFVSDEPPAVLVDRVAARFVASAGDIPETLRAIFGSAEFQDASFRQNKLKTPLEFVASSLRLLGAELVPDPDPQFHQVRMTLEGLGSTGPASEALSRAREKSVNWRLVEMGQPLFAYPAPTGYPEDSRYWQQPGLALQRMNFALALTDGAVSGVKLGQPDTLRLAEFAGLDTSLLPADLPPSQLLAAALASPSFQYR